MKPLILGISFLLSAATLGTASADRRYAQPPVIQAAGYPEAPEGYQEWDQNQNDTDQHQSYGQDQNYYGQQGTQQQPYNYYGQHPIPHDQGGGFCQHGSGHVHVYPVFDRHLFNQVNNAFVFIGDPADFGYDSSTYAYQGHHPFAGGHGGGNCYMGGSHRHLFAPVGVGFMFQRGAYRYGGSFQPNYYSMRPRFASYYDGYYRNHYTGGRYYRMRPPHAYMGWGRSARFMAPRPIVVRHRFRPAW